MEDPTLRDCTFICELRAEATSGIRSHGTQEARHLATTLQQIVAEIPCNDCMWQVGRGYDPQQTTAAIQ